MKLILIIALVFPMSIHAQNWKDLKKAAKKVNKELKSTSKQVKELSESDAAAALKETLNRGVEKGVDVLSLKGGFYNNLNVKVFVINNGGYASIRKSQDDMTGARYTDDDTVLNFKKVADAFELPFHIIEDYENLDIELSDIFSKDGPMLIEVVCDCNQKIIEPFGGSV